LPNLIPYPKEDIYANKLTPVTQVTQEAQDTLWIDHTEYPESGGIFVYRFGAEVLPSSITPERIKELEKDGKIVLESLNKLLNDSKFILIPGNNRVDLAPLEIFEANQIKPDLKTRVDELYPIKGFPTPEIVGATNFAKRALIGQIRFFANNWTVLLGLIFLPFKRKLKIFENWLWEYRELSWIALKPFLMQDSYYSIPSKAIKRFVEVFLNELGIKEDLFPKIFAHLIEFDTAYRYRIEDIASEANFKDLYNNPRKELKRLFNIFTQRETLRSSLRNKFRYIVSILSIVLLSRKIKKAFRMALLSINFKDICLDEADRYHVLRMNGYQFLGRSIEDRIEEFIKLHNGTPPQTIRVQG
jgi:hypothetical protein